MKKIGLSLIALALVVAACNTSQTQKKDMNNPFFSEYKTPFQVPPFNEIKLEHYMPAFDEGIAENLAEIKAITDNKEEPTFDNTILALDQAGELLGKVSNVFFNLNTANTDEKMQALAREITPKLSKHRDNIMLNKELFQRVKAVYEKRNDLKLDAEQMRVVEKYYRDFERSGANLPDDKQAELRKLNEELSMMELKFEENTLAETNKNFKMVIDNEADLKGLPAEVIAGAAELAKKDSLPGKWVFTLQKPSMIPFLQYAENRALREKIYKGYLNRGNNNNAFDNKSTIEKIIKTRDQRAKLLGYTNHAAYVIDVNMAKTPENVYNFLMKLWTPALERAKVERADMQKMIDAEGGKFKLEMWDWWYYAEKVRKAKFDLDESQLKPYLSLDNAINGMIEVCNKLYGIKFVKQTNLPIYNEEVIAYDVQEANGKHIGVFYMDFHPRPGKGNGAWCTSFREQSYKNGQMVTPVVSIVCNFTRPTGDTPALLSFDEVQPYSMNRVMHCMHYSPMDRIAVLQEMYPAILSSFLHKSWKTGLWNLKCCAATPNTTKPEKLCLML